MSERGIWIFEWKRSGQFSTNIYQLYVYQYFFYLWRDASFPDILFILHNHDSCRPSGDCGGSIDGYTKIPGSKSIKKVEPCKESQKSYERLRFVPGFDTDVVLALLQPVPLACSLSPSLHADLPNLVVKSSSAIWHLQGRASDHHVEPLRTTFSLGTHSVPAWSVASAPSGRLLKMWGRERWVKETVVRFSVTKAKRLAQPFLHLKRNRQ
jgi:hypothetical protein